MDVRVVDVESGHDVALDGATFSGDYRTNVRNLATKLAGQIAIKQGTSSSNTPNLGYVNLGLPSGTKWRTSNAAGFYTYEEAVAQFGNRLPTKEQWEELRAECQWSWTGSGYTVTGPNGNTITLPAAGFHQTNESTGHVGAVGTYWTSTTYIANVWVIEFTSNAISMSYYMPLRDGRSVRLVQN